MKFKLILLAFSVFLVMQGCVSKNVEEQGVEKKYEIADFSKIEIGMLYVDVLTQIDGSANTDTPNIGNLRWLIYPLKDGSKMKLGFLPNNILFTMEIIGPVDRVFSLVQEE